MCTAIHVNKNHTYFCRTMDFSYELDPELYIVPRNKLDNKYHFFGAAKDLNYLIFVDGVNEKGLGGAALYFEGFAHFTNDEVMDKENIK